MVNCDPAEPAGPFLIPSKMEQEMSIHVKRTAAVVYALLPIMLAIPSAASMAQGVFAPTAQVTVPGLPMASWDISFVDPTLGQFFLGDRTHNAVDVLNTSSPPTFAMFIGRGLFQGSVPAATCTARGGGPNDCSGPNGVLTVNHKQVWASDGNSTVKVFDLFNPGAPPTAVINTGGQFRGDEMCFDPAEQLVMVSNNSQGESTGPFASIIETSTYTIVKKIFFDGTNGSPKATNGAEQCSYSPRTGKFYITLPGVHNPDDGTGAVLVIGAQSLSIEQVFNFRNTVCDTPQGTAVGPGFQLLVGCNGSTHSTNSIIIDQRNGNVLAKVANESGGDEVWFNPGDSRYFLGISAGTAATQVLGVINASTLRAEQSAYTANKPSPPAAASHSVAADPVHNQVFVAIGGNGSSTVCSKLPGGSDGTGCIASYTASRDTCVAEGAPVISAGAAQDVVFMTAACAR